MPREGPMNDRVELAEPDLAEHVILVALDSAQ
jgi:hypothetical protein